MKMLAHLLAARVSSAYSWWCVHNFFRSVEALFIKYTVLRHESLYEIEGNLSVCFYLRFSIKRFSMHQTLRYYAIWAAKKTRHSIVAILLQMTRFLYAQTTVIHTFTHYRKSMATFFWSGNLRTFCKSSKLGQSCHLSCMCFE